MKHILSILLVLLLAALCACAKSASPEPKTTATAATTTEALTTTTEPLFTTTEPPTLLPVVEEWWWSPGFGWDIWVEGFPIFKESAKDYFELLDRYRQILAGGALAYGDIGVGVDLMLYDFDGDFIPELIVELTGNPGREWHVYTLHQGKTRFVGSFDATFRSSLLSCSKGGIYLSHLTSGATGAGEVTWIKKRGNQLTETILASWETGFERTWEEPSDSVLLLKTDLGDFAWTY